MVLVHPAAANLEVWRREIYQEGVGRRERRGLEEGVHQAFSFLSRPPDFSRSSALL